MVGMSSPAAIVPTERQESVRIRSLRFSPQETLKTGSLKFHLKISTLKEHNWINYPKGAPLLQEAGHVIDSEMDVYVCGNIQMDPVFQLRLSS